MALAASEALKYSINEYVTSLGFFFSVQERIGPISSNNFFRVPSSIYNSNPTYRFVDIGDVNLSIPTDTLILSRRIKGLHFFRISVN
jgi:hypothetical protein